MASGNDSFASWCRVCADRGFGHPCQANGRTVAATWIRWSRTSVTVIAAVCRSVALTDDSHLRQGVPLRNGPKGPPPAPGPRTPPPPTPHRHRRPARIGRTDMRVMFGGGSAAGDGSVSVRKSKIVEIATILESAVSGL